MTLYPTTVVTTGSGTSEVTTLDMTSLLDHVRTNQRQRHYVGRRRNTEPHPLLVACVALGGLLFVLSFCGLIIVLLVAQIL